MCNGRNRHFSPAVPLCAAISARVCQSSISRVKGEKLFVHWLSEVCVQRVRTDDRHRRRADRPASARSLLFSSAALFALPARPTHPPLARSSLPPLSHHTEATHAPTSSRHAHLHPGPGGLLGPRAPAATGRARAHRRRTDQGANTRLGHGHCSTVATSGWEGANRRQAAQRCEGGEADAEAFRPPWLSVRVVRVAVCRTPPPAMCCLRACPPTAPSST